ncbi:MAG TPA: hypothetical protein VGK90_07070 [Rhizomicrobium sp.]|jgi:hypothetical protein
MMHTPQNPSARHPRESEFLIAMRCFVTNASGERVLAGLSPSETEEYFSYVDLLATGLDQSAEQRDRWLQLYRRHEPARLALIAAESTNRSRVQN